MNKTNLKLAGEELRLPTDLRKALAATPTAKAQWRDLTPIARRDFISWIDSSKQPEAVAAGSRKPARCLRPESDGPDVFQSLTRFNLEDPDGNQRLVVRA